MSRRSRLRSRELRFGRAFRRIVLAALASPLAAATACSSESAPDGPADATVPGAAPVDAGRDSAPADAGADATLAPDGLSPACARDAAPPFDATACESIPFDGASIEGDQDGCVTYRALPCGVPAGAQREGCFLLLETCIELCGCDPSDAGYFIYCQLAPTSCDDAGNLLDAESIVEFVSCNGITGRRPLGLAPARLRAQTPLGDYFASMAHLEAASVRAFRDLGRWLERPRRAGAPVPGVERVRCGRAPPCARGHAPRSSLRRGPGLAARSTRLVTDPRRAAR